MELRSHQTHGASPVRNPDPGQAHGSAAGVLKYNRSRSRSNGSPNKAVAIRNSSPQSKKKRAGNNLTGITGYRTDFLRAISVELMIFECAKQLGKLHIFSTKGASFTVLIG
jgi:hypothetical protein